jgi:hypothetical protein
MPMSLIRGPCPCDLLHFLGVTQLHSLLELLVLGCRIRVLACIAALSTLVPPHLSPTSFSFASELCEISLFQRWRSQRASG